jgi:hypothetical protein
MANLQYLILIYLVLIGWLIYNTHFQIVYTFRIVLKMQYGIFCDLSSDGHCWMDGILMKV